MRLVSVSKLFISTPPTNQIDLTESKLIRLRCEKHFIASLQSIFLIISSLQSIKFWYIIATLKLNYMEMFRAICSYSIYLTEF